MKYYLRSNSNVWGPMAENDAISFLTQYAFETPVEASTDLTNWYPVNYFPPFQGITVNLLPQTTPNNSIPQNTNPIQQTNSNIPSHKKKDFSGLCFIAFAVLLIAGTIFGLYKIKNSTSQRFNPSSQELPAFEDQVKFVAQEITEELPLFEDVAFDLTVASANDGDALAKILEKHQQAIGLVAIKLPFNFLDNPYVEIGTAFAISENRFVTNAHVANGVLDLYRKFKKAGQTPSVRIYLNHSDGKYFEVPSYITHPRYNSQRDQGEFDVAILEINGKTDNFFEIATKPELHALKAGIPIASAGFPMEGLKNGEINIESPEATYCTGVIKKITDFTFKNSSPEFNRKITHSIPSAGGASGSPVFTGNGKVVAIHFGGTSHGFDSEGSRIKSALQQNYAVRIDQIDEIIDAKTRPWY